MAHINSFLMLISCLMFLSLCQGKQVETDPPSAWVSCPEGPNGYGSYCYYFNEESSI
ncbi:Lithostathine-1-beta [Heterocephalus glaber]|uniref:Lithostathine-1-beta n=1 Tax=Heterocephalus glaber TaxID=10181 RepID=G5BWU4_HETGA|nr:Lithostathine-1-beta [Heterocephalus glaber]